MELRRLLHPLLIFGAFGLGLGLGFALFAPGGPAEVASGAPSFLLLGLLGVAFGLVGLTAGAAAAYQHRERGGAPIRLQEGAELTGARLGGVGGSSSVHAGASASSPERRNAPSRRTPPESKRPTRPSPIFASTSLDESREDAWLGPDSDPSGASGAEDRAPRASALAHGSALEVENGGGQEPAISAPSSATPSPPPNASPGLRPEDLVRVWEQYEAEGDGHFTAAGLGRRLTAAGLTARAVSGDDLGVGDAILGVLPEGSNGPIYVLPDFNRPSSAVTRWFEDQGSGVRTAAIKRLIQVAEVERRGVDLEVVRKGIVA